MFAGARKNDEVRAFFPTTRPLTRTRITKRIWWSRGRPVWATDRKAVDDDMVIYIIIFIIITKHGLEKKNNNNNDTADRNRRITNKPRRYSVYYTYYTTDRYNDNDHVSRPLTARFGRQTSGCTPTTDEWRIDCVGSSGSSFHRVTIIHSNYSRRLA